MWWPLSNASSHSHLSHHAEFSIFFFSMLPKQPSKLSPVPTLQQEEQCPLSKGKEKEGETVIPNHSDLFQLYSLAWYWFSQHHLHPTPLLPSFLSLLPPSPSPLPSPLLLLSSLSSSGLLCVVQEEDGFSVLILGNPFFLFCSPPQTKVQQGLDEGGHKVPYSWRRKGMPVGAGLRPRDGDRKASPHSQCPLWWQSLVSKRSKAEIQRQSCETSPCLSEVWDGTTTAVAGNKQSEW